METLQENDAIRQLLQVLGENERQLQQADLSHLVKYLDDMDRQFAAVLQELRDVKRQLAQAQRPVYGAHGKREAPPAAVMETVEKRVRQAQGQLQTAKKSVAICAKEMVERVRQVGVQALDRGMSAIGVRGTLERMRRIVRRAVAGIQTAVERMEDAGKELRGAGSHLRNSLRAIGGQDMEMTDVSKEGRVQASVLAPMRLTHRALRQIDQSATAAIGTVDRLERSAEAARSARKPSVRRLLAEKRAEAAARPTRERPKTEEISL